MIDTSPASCPVCRSANQEHSLDYNDCAIYRCNDCGTYYVHGMKENADTADNYENAYDGGTTGYFRKVEKKLRRSRGRIRQLRKYVKGGRFLDVGCNGGFMAEAARQAGFDAWGVEVDGVSVAYAKEHFPENHYFHGLVENFHPDEGFDLVYSSEVIEHIPDVNAYMSAVVGLMKPNAILYQTTPDIAHWSQPRDLTRREGFNPPHHCIYFTTRSMRMLLENHGLEIVEKRFAFKPGIKFIARKPASTG